MVLRLRLILTLLALSVCEVAAESNSPQQVQVPPGTAKGLLVFKVQPSYPPLARQAGVQGTVVLRAFIGKDGTVQNLTVISGHPMLIQAAMDAVKQWRYKPYSLNGEPVLVETTINVNFTLDGAPPPAQSKEAVATGGNNAGQAASSPSPAAVAGQDVATLFANASSAMSGNDCGTAIPLAKRVTEIQPQHGGAWNLLGLCYFELDELQEAEASFKRQIEVSPQSAYAYNNLGRVYARKRNFEMADVQFRKQIELNARDRHAHMNLALSLYSQHKCDQAITEFQLAAELTPENAGPHAGLAQCYLDQGKQESGIRELDKAAALTSSGQGWSHLAWIMAEHQFQLERAEQYARLAISMESTSLTVVSLDPLTPGALGRTRLLTATWDTLGWILFLRGDLASAEKYLLASWTPQPSPTLSDHLAQLYEKLGHKQETVGYSALAVTRGEYLSEAQDSDVAAVSNSRQRLARLAPPSADVNQIARDWQQRLEQQDSFTLANPAKHSGTAEFALLLVHGQSSAKARWMAGDPSLKDFEGEVAARAPALPAEAGAIDLLRWGRLNCEQPDAECHFQLYSARSAVYAQLRSTVKPMASVTPQSGQSVAAGQHPGAYRVGGDVTAPRATYAPDPQYSKQARKAGFEGTVVLWLVVDPDGLPQNIRVQRPLGMGLDEEAVKAVKQWRFQPATKDSKPVSVMINVEVNFRLYAGLYPHPNSNGQPPRFPGVNVSEYPLVVRRNASDWQRDATGVRLTYRVIVMEGGQERRVSISCRLPAPDCLALNDGAYPAKWLKEMSTIEILGLPRRNESDVEWKKGVYMVAEDGNQNAPADADATVNSRSSTTNPPSSGLNGSNSQVPLFICRAMDLPDGWKPYDQ